MTKDLLSDASDSEDGGAQLTKTDFTINESYARRFEHNKKREELQRLEEKHGRVDLKRKRGSDDEDVDGSDESTSESEDEGELATEQLDHEIMATINAIRSKDPRVYNPDSRFYTAPEENDEGPRKSKREKPMNLKDYHRQNLLNGVNGDEEEQPVLTYNQEQEKLKNSILGEINAAAGQSDDENDSNDENFMVSKIQYKPTKVEVLDVDNADKDPETFLSNFMSSRAWAAQTDRNLQPFESDDEEEERRAEEFEQAYNFRFEDPAKSNEKLISHARDLAAKYSVRREETNPRQKKRQAEKEQKEADKQQRKEEKLRLRRLKIEAVENKVSRIKKAAGIKSSDLQPEDWAKFVDEDWDDEQWEQEMQKRFGEQYYADQDVGSDDEARKPKKPKFDDDIDIKDIVPDFEEEAQFSLSDEDQQDYKKRREEKKREAKRDRRIIEQLVDDQLQYDLDHALPERTVGFRYRETSPKAFGLTAKEILLADDGQLNEFAGLKKLAAFRDPEKKAKDQKHLGKRARLRKWRKEVFGNEEGLHGIELVPIEAEEAEAEEEAGGVDIIAKGKKKRRRSKKHKIPS